MADKFNGFSQDEINKVSGVARAKNIHGPLAEPIKQAFRGQHGGIRRMPEKWSRSVDQQRKQQLGSQASVATSSAGITAKSTETKNPTPPPEKEDTLEEINLNSSMSKSIEEALYFQPTKKPTGSTNECGEKKANGATSNLNNADANESSILKLPIPTMDNNISSTSSAMTNESSILPSGKPAETVEHTDSALNVDSPFKGVSLRDFEAHRKMIEEQNKQKKELLYKAIERHSQKTAAEARKIAEIKSELAKLDNDLALDVSILRKQIDNACIHFAQVEKQYMKIEAQFLKAKIDLHNASEKKELLTEHLCTVIAHNEDRKAQKLAELMQKVGLTETGEYLQAESNSATNDK